MASVRTIAGSCDCGNIQWTSIAAPEHLDFCYCLTCQKVSGAPFMAWMGVSKACLKWTLIRNDALTYRSTVGDTGTSVAERTCCISCGSNISLQYQLYPEKTHIAASTIDKNEFETPKVGCHIWTKSVPSWYTLPGDGIERFQEFDPDFQARLDKYLQETQNRTAKRKQKGGWWAGMLPGDAPDYSSITGPDTTTMADLWEDPSKVRRSQRESMDTTS